MDSDDLPTQPPAESFVPWKPGEAHKHMEFLRDFQPDNATADSMAALMLVIVENMQCPHVDCPRLVLEHHEHG